MPIAEIKLCLHSAKLIPEIVSSIARTVEGADSTPDDNYRKAWTVYEGRTWAAQVFKICRQFDCASQDDAVSVPLINLARINREAGKKFGPELQRIRQLVKAGR